MSVNSKMTAIADAIREKTGGTDPLTLDQMAAEIESIKTSVELPTLENPGSASELEYGKQLIDGSGNIITGTLGYSTGNLSLTDCYIYDWSDSQIAIVHECTSRRRFEKGACLYSMIQESVFGDATPDDVRQGKTFTSAAGFLKTGTALIPGGGFVYPDGAFTPVTSFTDGKQYALVAMIDGVRRYINTTTYNDYTMNATEITIAENADKYVIFSATPALFTAVASGSGFLLQNGDNYLHGTSSGGTALRFGTTQMVWTVDDSATGGFSEGKYYVKEDPNAVWLMNADGGYTWSIKYEIAGSFGYDRDGRDSTYSTGFVPVVLYEYVGGEGEVNPVVDTSNADARANDIVNGKTAYVNGRKIEGNVREINADAYYYVDDEYGVSGKMMTSTLVSATYPMDQDTLFRKGTNVEFRFPVSQLGLSTGSTIKTGSTTSATIATGLSSIEKFFIFKDGISGTGLIHLYYSSTDGTSYTYASAWATTNYGTKTIKTDTTAATVSGGSITLPSSSATSGGLSSGVTYTWVAIGK